VTEHVEVVDGASPNEVHDPRTRFEIKRATVWLGMACGIALIVLLVQPLLLIFAALVFAAMLDGGVRLLKRILPIGRGWRLLIVVLLVVAFLVGTFYIAGVQLIDQATQLRATLEVQAQRGAQWLSAQGMMPGASDLNGFMKQALGSVGRVTSFLGNAASALTNFFMILVLGLFLAIEPNIYERGLQWMVPVDKRKLLAGRLLGMVAEGVLTWVALMIAGVPMAAILGILTGLLAFIPNIGAFISGALMVAVGFSAGYDTGIAAIIVYVVVQTFDGYVLLPIVAKKTVDLPPALTLGAQILASALFGIMGLALADPMTAMIKVALERRSEAAEESMDADELVA
jgi:predicted PurR-regulated permease PerM